METIHRQFEVEEGQYRQIKNKVIEEERPPMVDIEAYRNRLHLKWHF